MESIFALAEERQVPMLIHAGAGLPPEFGVELVEIVDRHPGVRLILAHMGVTDQAVMADGLRDHPSIVYDTSWMNAFEIMTLACADPGGADRVRLRSAVWAYVQRSLPAPAIVALPWRRWRLPWPRSWVEACGGCWPVSRWRLRRLRRLHASCGSTRGRFASTRTA